MTDNIKNMKSYVSDIVGKAMTGTFDTMFGREITSTGAGEGVVKACNDDISSHVSLTQGAALNVDFSFHFDSTLLTAIAEETYPDQARNIPMQLICEDMACAIANVVGSRVKAFLNGRGYDLSMDIPAVGSMGEGGSAREGREQTHLTFQYGGTEKNAAIVVNIHLQEKRAG